METNYPETTLRDYLRVPFRHKTVIIATFVIVMITVFIGLKFKTPVYEASVKMLISAKKQVEARYYRDLSGYRKTEIARTQSEIVKSNPVIERAAKAIKLDQRPFDYEKYFCSPLKMYLINLRLKMLNDKFQRLIPEQKQAFIYRKTIEDLKRNIKVEPIRDTDVFTISVRDFSPVMAAMFANVISRSYVIFDLEQQLTELQIEYGQNHSSVVQLRDNITKMRRGLTGKPISIIEAIGPASVKIIEQAHIPLEPVEADKPLILVLAFFMSGLLGIMLAFGFEYMDQSFKSPQDVETFLNLLFLGSIPKKKLFAKPLIKDAKQETPYTQAYQNLSDQIYLLMKDKHLNSILITGALPMDGTSIITANIGTYLAHKASHKVLVIDANLRDPSLHKIFKISEGPGLASVLEGKTSFEDAIQNLSPNLAVLPAGNTALNPITLLDSSKMADVLEVVRERYEVVFVDCADLKNFRDSVVLSSSLGGVALVVNEGRTRRQVVKSAIAPLQRKKANLIGVILNNRRFVIPKAIYERV